MASSSSSVFIGRIASSFDALLAYETPKIVVIKDRVMGMVKLSLLSLIFLYIVVYSILYQGSHFQPSTISGIMRMQWQEPTKDFCNPTDIDCKANYKSEADLPYCNAYVGDIISINITKAECQYYDAKELPINLPGGVLIPTYRKYFHQRQSCELSDSSCDKKYLFVDEKNQLQRGSGEAKPIHQHFVADVDDFTVMIDHSFRTSNGLLAYDDVDMEGYWATCDEQGLNCTTKSIKCMHADCKNRDVSLLSASASLSTPMRRFRQSSSSSMTLQAETEEIVSASLEESTSVETEEKLLGEQVSAALDEGAPASLENGDIFSLSTLLTMAGKSLDDPAEEDGNQTIRQRGAALVVRITYENYVPWRLWTPKETPAYTISVNSRPVHKFKHMSVSSDSRDGRELTYQYGIYIVVEQEGNIVTFNGVHAIVTLTAGMALVAAASFMTDMIALYAMPRKEVYNSLKYQKSQDFDAKNDDVLGQKDIL